MKPSRFSSSLQKILNGDSQLRITFSHGDILVLAECEEVDPSIYDEKGRWCCDIVEAVSGNRPKFKKLFRSGGKIDIHYSEIIEIIDHRTEAILYPDAEATPNKRMESNG